MFMISRTALTIFRKFGNMFRAHEDDLDRSQTWKNLGCLSVILSLNTNLLNLENHSNDFHSILYYMHFKHEKTTKIGPNIVKSWIACLSVREHKFCKYRAPL